MLISALTLVLGPIARFSWDDQLLVNFVASWWVLATFPLVLYWPNQSIVAKLGRELLSAEVWRLYYQKRYKKFFEEIRFLARSLVPVSGALAALGLATIAFSVSNLPQDGSIAPKIGIGMMTFSTILYFWSLGTSFTASVPTLSQRDAARWNRLAFALAYFFITFGIYTYFLGLIWTLSRASILLTYVCYLKAMHRAVVSPNICQSTQTPEEV